MTLQKHSKTTIFREYPSAHGEPYYPMPIKDALALAEKYQAKTASLQSVSFIGRLAEYRYYNMDQAVKRALDVFKTIAKD